MSSSAASRAVGFSSTGARWRQRRASITERLGLAKRPTTAVRDLNVAEQQMVEIARALSMKSRLIVMDEPTSALSSTEVEKLFAIIRDLKAQGLSIVFVTHRLEEVMRICDRYTVLRDGRSGRQRRCRRHNDRRHHPRRWSGRDVSALFAHRDAAKPGDVALKVEGSPGAAIRRMRTRRCWPTSRLQCGAARSSGFAGLVGAGRTEMARAIFGADPFDSGRVIIDGDGSAYPLAAGRDPPRHRAGAGGSQAAGAVPGARGTPESLHGGARPHHAARHLHRRESRARRWWRNSARR